VHGDRRGFFCEIFNSSAPVPPGLEWFSDFSWVRQANRSASGPGVLRGMHAQRGASCQGKLVSVPQGAVYDVICDMRPASETFGRVKAYWLDSRRQNMLWVPRGFLHGFCTFPGSGRTTFEYFCDNVYDKASETGVYPVSLMEAADPDLRSMIGAMRSENGLNLSPKDAEAQNIDKFSDAARREYEASGKAWYE